MGFALYGEGYDATLAQGGARPSKKRGGDGDVRGIVHWAGSCGRVRELPRTSDALNESYVTYSNEAKEKLLGVQARDA